jgi:hypothetical protein
MTRAVLSIDPLGALGDNGAELTIVKVVRAPWMVPDQGKAHALQLAASALPPWHEPHAVRLRGQCVRNALVKHPGVARMLDLLPGQHDVTPLYLILSEGEVELIGWETLCDQTDAFLSLDQDQRFPIGRIVEPSHDEARAPSSLRLPIRLMAIISAIGADGRPEWEYLFDAVKTARAAGLEMQLRVLVGDPALRTLIDQAVLEPGHAPWLSVSHIDVKGSEVVQAISQWKPQIVHVFCHGDAEDTDQLLELATETDYLQGAPKGSTLVRASQLARMVDLLPNPWLITLNACDTGHAASAINSMAHRMVRAGFPAAVAMLEPVNERDAHIVTRAFYSRMFQLLDEVSTTLQTAEEAPFEWLRPMSAVREALVEEHGDDPTSAREWTLPVLYVRGVAPFCFRKPIANVSPHEAEEYKKRAAIVAQWLVGPGASQPVEVRQGAIAAALHDLPRPFWPEVDGTWSPDAVSQVTPAAPAVPQPPAAGGGG